MNDIRTGSDAWWQRVENCKHANLTDYGASGFCGGAEGCSGWNEYYCRDCGVYFTECPCGCSSSRDTISWRQRKEK